MSEEQLSLTEIKEDLEELISLLAQTSDSTAINLASKFEKFEKDLEYKDQKRWSVFQWFMGSIIFVLSIMIPILYIGSDKIQTNIAEASRRLSLVEAENKDQVSKHDLVNAIEKRFSTLESSIKDVVTIKDLERMKTELIQFVIKYHNDGGRTTK
jgi:hypothetical protein